MDCDGSLRCPAWNVSPLFEAGVFVGNRIQHGGNPEHSRVFLLMDVEEQDEDMAFLRWSAEIHGRDAKERRDMPPVSWPD